MADEKCRVCEAETSVVHYGIGICRACAVFYRRTRARKTPFTCKNDRNCTAEGDHLCKRCRFDQIEQLFAQKRTKRGNKVAKVKPKSHPAIASTSTPMPQTTPSNPISILEKLRQAYKLLCTIRRTTELTMRAGSEAVLPISIASGQYELLPSTPATMNEGSRILSTALLEFAIDSFQEFSTFSNDEQWLLARTFQKPFHICDCGYRSIPAFGKNYTRHFTSFTRIMDVEYAEQYAAASGTEHVEAAKRESIRHQEVNVKPSRIAFTRFAASEDELVAMLGLLFWHIDIDQVVRPEMLDIAEHYRTRILQDLRRYYARVNYAEYGKRMGELLCMCNLVMSSVSKNKQMFEVARLLDVFTADSFAYNIHRNHKV